MKYSIDQRKMMRRRGERGVALLFAIGILAMLMMLGLGFVTNALIANRIASNNSRRSQARTIARAAVAQAMAQILLYVDQADQASTTVPDFDAIRSREDTPVVNTTDSDTALTNKVELNDQLTGTNTKFSYSYNAALPAYTADDVAWTFFYDDADSSDKKIIGRAAWKVLPQSVVLQSDRMSVAGRSGCLNLYRTITGAVSVGAGDTEPATIPDKAKKFLSECGKVPWLHRWGRGIEELYLDLDGSPFHQWISNGNNGSETPPYTFDMLFTYAGFDSDLRKAWSRLWFAEGTNRQVQEAYPYIDSDHNNRLVYLHRFNLGGRYDPFSYAESGGSIVATPTTELGWYERFPAGTVQNLGAGEKNVIDELGRVAQSFRENDNVDDNTYYSGLPFLKRIGNDAWSFNGDTPAERMANFRKQIAANLNDYCDADDIPTGDVPAAEWSISDSTKFPKYTGNEKTAYINEFAWVFDLPKLSFSKPGSGKFSSYAIKPAFDGDKEKAAAAMFAELVNIYDADPESASYSLTARLEEVEISFALTVTYTVDLMVNFTNSDDSAGHTTTTATLEVPYALTMTKPTGETKVDLAFGDPAAGYRIKGARTTQDLTLGGGSLDDPTSTLNNKCNDEATAAVTAAGGSSLASWSVASLKVAVRVVPTVTKFEMSPLMLSCGSGKPVDFANFSAAAAGAMTIASADAAHGDTKYLNIVPTAESPKLPLRFVLAGFETIDPRQNLNPKFGVDKTDWYLKPTLFAAKVGGDSAAAATAGSVPENLSDPLKFPTMDYVDAATDPAAVFTAGKVNSCSNPSIAQIVTSGALAGDADHADPETATDPAWLGGAAGQHISTAVIRNAPMKSLWELGAIHRARPWQTLNLTGASNFVASGTGGGNITAEEMDPAKFANWAESEGTDYVKGDGGILDMVKLSNACRAWGKLDVSLLTTEKIATNERAISGMRALDHSLIKALFHNIYRGSTLQEFITYSSAASSDPEPGTKIDASGFDVSKFLEATDALPKKSLLRSELLNTKFGESGDTCGLALTTNDAQQEEIIGKTIGLFGPAGKPNVFQVLVVAQSIDDIGGYNTDIPVVKNDSGGTPRTVKCQQGVFNYYTVSRPAANGGPYNLYFDRITGEVKLVATIERDPETGTMIIRQLEYLD